jgi:hypothetical protein
MHQEFVGGGTSAIRKQVLLFLSKVKETAET